MKHWLWQCMLVWLACWAGVNGVLAADVPSAPILRLEAGMHTAAIRRINTDASGRYAVTASDDKTARVWEVASCRLLQTLRVPIGPGDEGKLYAMAITPDAKVVAVAGWTGWNWNGQAHIYLFARESGQLLRRLTGLPNVIFHLAFSPDGRWLAATLGAGSGVRVWDWQQNHPPLTDTAYAFAKILEEVLPDKGLFIAELFLRQGAAYINDKALAAKIDSTVKKQIFDGSPDPTIVIAHSLGSVVSYRLLANNQQANRNVPLFVTLGSPLGVDIFKPILPPKGSMPSPPIGKWLNGHNREDFVTLDRAITKTNIGFDGVIDETDIVNPDEDKHSITRYLASPKIAKAIYDAL